MKRFVMALLLVLTLLPGALIFAQDDAGQTVTLPDGTAITLPESWAFAAEETTYVFSSSDATGLVVMPPAATGDYYGVLGNVPSPAQLMERIYAGLFSALPDGDAIVEDTDRAEYAFEQDDQQGLAVVVAREDGLWFYAVYAPVAEFDAAQGVADAILVQLALVPAADPAAEGTVACYVSTDADLGVALRLGPGQNRGVYTALKPADGEVLVLGQAEADDGSLWYKVEEDYDMVNELWVAAADVTTSGDCDLVGESAAPGLIAPAPGYVPAAPATEVPSGDPGAATAEEPAAAPEEPAAATNGDLKPAAGWWRMSAPPSIQASCEGTGTVTIPFDEGMSRSVRISHSGASVLMLDGSYTYTFVNNGNGYFTAHNVIPTSSNQYMVMHLYVTSPTVMSGALVVGWTDLPCSGTLPLTFGYGG